MIDLSPARLVGDYRARRRDPRDVLKAVYAQIEQAGVRPVWIALAPFEAALERLARAPADGPLYGVPFGVKDNIDVQGLPTSAGCPDFASRPHEDAESVARLVRAGAIPIGKTNLDQFATGLVGTRSPYGAPSSVFDARYVSGGSSSGSAVAVARGDVPFALGTDTAGSGRVPAAFNALVGLKPTRGLISARGVVPACRSLDCVSIFARSVADAELVFDAARGYDARDAFARRAEALPRELGARPRLGVPTPESLEFFGDGESARLFDAAVARLSGLAGELVPIDLTLFREAASLLYQGPWIAERLAGLELFLEQHADSIHPVIRAILESAKRPSAADAFRGTHRLAELARATGLVWERIDALLLPTAPTHYTIEQVTAEPFALNQNLGTYTNFVNLLDLAAIALPAGFRDDGLPFGVTFAAPRFEDLRLLELGRRFLGEAPAPPAGPPPGCVWLAVAGAHLEGQPLNGELTSRGARRVRTLSTAPEYRLFALDTTPPKPGLVHSPGEPGHAIEVELWELTEQAFGSFVARIPAPMTIGVTRLEDGSLVKGFSCEPRALEGARDISRFGGWRAYLAAR